MADIVIAQTVIGHASDRGAFHIVKRGSKANAPYRTSLCGLPLGRDTQSYSSRSYNYVCGNCERIMRRRHA